MSTHIGTNFSYDSKDFLDGRVGKAKTKEDLKNWNTSVPEGFEVCLNGTWYYYSESLETEDTGHWIPRISDEDDIVDPDKQSASFRSIQGIKGELENVLTALEGYNRTNNPVSFKTLSGGNLFSTKEDLDIDLRDKIDRITNTPTYSKDLDFTGDGILSNDDIEGWRSLYTQARGDISYTSPTKSSTYTVEVGTKLIPALEWSIIQPQVCWSLSGNTVVWSVVKGTDTNYVNPKEVSVSGQTKGILKTGKWESKEILTSPVRRTFTYTVSANLGDGQVLSGSVWFKFSIKQLWGTATVELWNKTSLTMSDLTGFGSKFSESPGFSKTSFNCTGGRYPYILIPSEAYNSDFKTYVNDNLNSDFLVKDVSLVNALGTVISYKMLRTGMIQTGSNIGIEIK